MSYQREGTEKTPGIRRIVVLLLAVLIVVAGLVVWGIVALSNGGGSEEPATVGIPDSSKSIVLTVSAEGSLDAETLTSVRRVIESHATNAGMDLLAVTESGQDAMTVSFDAGTDDELIARFGQSVATPSPVGFSPVFAVIPGTGGLVDGVQEATPPCADLPFGSASWNGFVLACDDEDLTQYVLDGEPRLSGTAIDTVAQSGDVLAVTLNADAADELEKWTGELAAQTEPGRIAIVDINGVLSAPVVQGAISGGEFQISGGENTDTEEVADRLRVLGAGVVFSLG